MIWELILVYTVQVVRQESDKSGDQKGHGFAIVLVNSVDRAGEQKRLHV